MKGETMNDSTKQTKENLNLALNCIIIRCD